MQVYTDGSCLGNPGPGGWAVVCDEFRLCGGENMTTNNVMEMVAVIKAYVRIKNKPATIFTDSSYVKNGIEKWIDGWIKKGWMTAKGEPVKNKKLWMKLDLLRKANPNVTIKWVKAHNGNVRNEEADKLARGCATLMNVQYVSNS
jgi:ribonuclease HI